jgi:leader peptidase (prepilin peptidase)/N-methyltransferase
MLVLIIAVTLTGIVSARFVNRLIDRPLESDIPTRPVLNTRPQIRQALVGLCTTTLFVAVALRLHALQALAALPAYLYFVAIGVALSFIDIASHRLPNAIVFRGYSVIGLLLTGAALWNRDGDALLRVLIGAAGLYAFYFLLALIYPAGMGFGDVKLAGILGGVLAYLSYSALFVGALAGFVLGSVAGLVVIVSRRGNRKTAVPFGPFMIAGALVGILAGAQIAHAYVHHLGAG